MTAVESLYNEFVQYCENNTNEATKKKYQRFFVEGYDAYGLDQKGMEQTRDRLWKQYGSQLSMPEAFILAEKCWSTGKYELMSFGYWVTKPFIKDFTADTFAEIGRWFDHYVINWAHSDILSGDYLSYFVNQKIVPLSVYSQWIKADSRWRRRGCVVGLINPVQQGVVSVSDGLEVIRPAMLDGEKVVKQGLGWFLREAWKVQPQPVEAFLLEYKDTCGRLIIQYATEKMTAENKARFKKSKSA